MITGLNAIVKGTELKELCLKRAEHHRNREKVYADQKASMDAAKIEGMNYSGGNPTQAIEEKRSGHASSADELDFIANHLDADEEYLLDRAALVKLGFGKSGW